MALELTSLPLALTLQFFDQLAEALAAGLEVRELVEARAGRREQHYRGLRSASRPVSRLARRGSAGSLERPLKALAGEHLRRDVRERHPDRRCVFADQIDTGARSGDRLAQHREVLSLALTPEDQVQRASCERL